MIEVNARGSSGADLAFITVLRGAAACVVVWDHLVGCWLQSHGLSWGPATFIETYLNGPLMIFDYGGFFGVSLFFLISGFIITHVAQREHRLAFGVKRLFRIYPPLIVTVLLMPFLCSAAGRLLNIPNFMDWVTPADQGWSCSLLNYFFFFDNRAVNAAAWTLAIEVMFYALCLVILPLLQRRPRLAVLLELAAIFLLQTVARKVGLHFELVAMIGSYLPCLFLGQIAYFLWSNRIRFHEYAVFSVAAYFLFLRGLMRYTPSQVAPENPWMVSIVYAYSVFVIAMLLSHKIHPPQVMRGVSQISYSLYLWNDNVGKLVHGAMRDLPFLLSLMTALTVVFAVSTLSWLLVEQPSQRIARRLMRYAGHSANPVVVAGPIASVVRSRAAA